MEKRRYSYTELGMLFGIFVGSGLAVVLFTTTGNAIYFVIIGVGLALGLGLGAAYEQSLQKKKDRELEQKGENRGR